VRATERSRIWRKTMFSGTSGCVEVAFDAAGVLVRDSTTTDGPHLTVTASSWTSFQRWLRDGAPAHDHKGRTARLVTRDGRPVGDSDTAATDDVVLGPIGSWRRRTATGAARSGRCATGSG
jgi:hypothetical protein